MSVSGLLNVALKYDKADVFKVQIKAMSCAGMILILFNMPILVNFISFLNSDTFFFDFSDKNYISYGAISSLLPFIFYILFLSKEWRLSQAIFSLYMGVVWLISIVSILLYDVSYGGIHHQSIMNSLEYTFFENVMYSYILVFYMLYVIFCFIVYPKKSQSKKSDDITHGGAEFATLSDLKKKDLVVPKSDNAINAITSYITYGKLDGSYIGSPILKNTLCVSKAGGGKGTTSVVNFLLEANYPCLINDIKSEMLQMVSKHRYEKFGMKAIIFDPLNVLLSYDAEKWGAMQTLHLDLCNIGIEVDTFEYCEVLASAIVAIPAKMGDNAVFFKTSEKIIKGILFYLIEKKKPLTDLYKLCIEEDFQKVVKPILSKFNEELQEPNSAISIAIRNIDDMYEKGALSKFGQSVSNTVGEQVDFLGRPDMKAMFSRGDPKRTFNISEYLAGKADIYMIVPEHMVAQTSKFIRMIISIIEASLCFSAPSERKAKHYPWVLDEVAQLGYLKNVERAYEILRAKGVILKLYFQDLIQLQVYDKGKMFESFDVLQFFEVNGKDNIEYLQKLAGRRTVQTQSVGTKRGGGLKNLSTDINVNTSIAGVDLLSADTIREMDETKQIIIYTGCPVMFLDRNYYYLDKRFSTVVSVNYTMGKFQEAEYGWVKDRTKNDKLAKTILEDRVAVRLKQPIINIAVKNKLKYEIYKLQKDESISARIGEAVESKFTKKGSNTLISLKNINKMLTDVKSDINDAHVRLILASLDEENYLIKEDEDFYKIV